MSQSPTASDQRSVRRWNLKVALPVYDQATKAMIGQAINISIKGMVIACEEPIPTQQDQQLLLDIPQPDNSWSRTDLRTSSVWCNLDTDTDLFNIGLRFVYMPPEAFRAIQNLIDVDSAIA